MVQQIKNYTFNAASKTVTFTDYGSITKESVLYIKNVTTNQDIYNIVNLGSFGGSVATNVLTFTATNSGMNNTDKLFIKYDPATSLDTQLVSGTFWQTTQPVNILTATNSIAKNEDMPSATLDTGVPAMAIRKATPANSSDTDGDYEMLQMSAGRLYTSTTIDAALPAGTNAIGKLAANSGVDIGALTANQSVNVSQINGVTPLMGNGATGTGSQRVTIANDNTDIPVKLQPQTSGGLTTYHLVSAASANATVVKSSAGQLFGWYVYNSNNSSRKLTFHNASSTPTAGASVFFSIVIPPLGGANVFTDIGIAFSTGISITTTTGLTDADSASVALNDLVINLFYR